MWADEPCRPRGSSNRSFGSGLVAASTPAEDERQSSEASGSGRQSGVEVSKQRKHFLRAKSLSALLTSLDGWLMVAGRQLGGTLACPARAFPFTCNPCRVSILAGSRLASRWGANFVVCKEESSIEEQAVARWLGLVVFGCGSRIRPQPPVVPLTLVTKQQNTSKTEVNKRRHYAVRRTDFHEPNAPRRAKRISDTIDTRSRTARSTHQTPTHHEINTP